MFDKILSVTMLLTREDCYCSIPEFYDRVLNTLLEHNQDLFDEYTIHYDCRKIRVHRDVANAIIEYYREEKGMDDEEIGQLFMLYGPKTGVESKAYFASSILEKSSQPDPENYIPHRIYAEDFLVEVDRDFLVMYKKEITFLSKVRLTKEACYCSLEDFYSLVAKKLGSEVEPSGYDPGRIVVSDPVLEQIVNYYKYEDSLADEHVAKILMAYGPKAYPPDSKECDRYVAITKNGFVHYREGSK